MDFLKKLDTLKQVVEDHPIDSLQILELLTTISKDLIEIKERLNKLEKTVG
jgi:hypothetical protein